MGSTSFFPPIVKEATPYSSPPHPCSRVASPRRDLGQCQGGERGDPPDPRPRGLGEGGHILCKVVGRGVSLLQAAMTPPHFPPHVPGGVLTVVPTWEATFQIWQSHHRPGCLRDSLEHSACSPLPRVNHVELLHWTSMQERKKRLSCWSPHILGLFVIAVWPTLT